MAISPEDISTRAVCRPAQPDRRQRRRLITTERRSGVDRRRSVCRPPAAAAPGAPALRLRDRPARLVELLVLVNLLSVMDLLMTLEFLRLGAVEINPIMARLFESGPGTAAVAKVGVVLLATFGLWLLRRHRAALTTAVGLAAVYGSLVAFELVGLIWHVV
jgi:Domain of unknown function (DUF5658)